MAHLVCVRTHIIAEPNIILRIIDVTENLALSENFLYEKINAGSKINAGRKSKINAPSSDLTKK